MKDLPVKDYSFRSWVVNIKHLPDQDCSFTSWILNTKHLPAADLQWENAVPKCWATKTWEAASKGKHCPTGTPSKQTRNQPTNQQVHRNKHARVTAHHIQESWIYTKQHWQSWPTIPEKELPEIWAPLVQKRSLTKPPFQRQSFQKSWRHLCKRGPAVNYHPSFQKNLGTTHAKGSWTDWPHLKYQHKQKIRYNFQAVLTSAHLDQAWILFSDSWKEWFGQLNLRSPPLEDVILSHFFSDFLPIALISKWQLPDKFGSTSQWSQAWQHENCSKQLCLKQLTSKVQKKDQNTQKVNLFTAMMSFGND